MKTESFQKYIETRLTKAEIAEIDRQARLEAKAFLALQKDVAKAMNDYMEKEKIGFNEVARRLQVSPTHVAKIKKGEANLTLMSLARLAALLGQGPHITFTGKK
jgi:transcriptional regulator with XRE-family HTH domain